MKLRYYQSDSINATFDYFAKGGTGNPINALPTGTGKSVIIAEFIRIACAHFPKTRVMMLTHVKELIEQNFEKLLTLWPTAPAGIYSSGLKRKDTHCPITYAGIGSVNGKSHLFGHIDLIVIDEAHLVSPKSTTMYRKFIDDLKKINPKIKVIGYTATAYRLGTGMLTDGGLFTDICYDATKLGAFNRLISEGFLAPLVPKRTKSQLDVSDVRIQGGEFVLKELQNAVDREEVTFAALHELREQAEDRNHWLIFATGIEHSQHIVDMLDSMGISAIAVHSKMKAEDRDAAIAMFKAGEVRALVNNNILTTGFDFPAMDCIAVLRPTSSPGLWVQMLGRGTRPYEGKENCLVLDFAGNTKRLGPINDPVLPRKKGKKGGGVAPVRCCDACNTYCHASLRLCPECGEEFPREVKIRTQAASDNLIIGDLPVIEPFNVSTIVYAIHTPRDNRPPSLKVTYYCGLRQFSEYICIEHTGFAGKRARDWWRERDMDCTDDSALPADVEAAMDMAGGLLQPTSIKVWVNKKYPEIKDWDFTERVKEIKPEIYCSMCQAKTPLACTCDDDIPF